MNSVKKANDLQIGGVSATSDELSLKDAKIRVTMMIDLKTVREYKSIAERLGSKYQTLMNQALKEALYVETNKIDIITRLEKLENSVFKKKAV